jgi:hypothetical protein
VTAGPALYGMIKSPLLFYRKLRRDLESIDFNTNPYDICVANKQVNGEQLTVAFHVDDLKVSHVDPKVVDKFLEWIKKLYEDPTIKKIVPSRGKIHNYLGINCPALFSSSNEARQLQWQLSPSFN